MGAVGETKTSDTLLETVEKLLKNHVSPCVRADTATVACSEECLLLLSTVIGAALPITDIFEPIACLFACGLVSS